MGRLLLCGLWSVLLGCGGDIASPGSNPHAYWALQLNQHAVNLALTAPYNTIQLTTTAVTATGIPLAETGSATFQAIDTTVSVDNTGRIVAHSVTPGTQVVATLTVQGLTLKDTVQIQVVPTPPVAPLGTFSIHPAVGDSARCGLVLDGVGGVCQEVIPVYATDAQGDTVANKSANSLSVYFTSSNRWTAMIDRTSGQLTAVDTGSVTIVATTWAYGVAKRDSIRFTVGLPLYRDVVVFSRTPVTSRIAELYFNPQTATIAVGGSVNFVFDHQDSWSFIPGKIDVVFDDPENVEAGVITDVGQGTGQGNIPAFGTLGPRCAGVDAMSDFCGEVIRKFPIAGAYSYHSTLYPTSSGVIYVKPNHQ